MLADEIKAGESSNIEFKVEVPKKSEKYIKSVVAFANTAGGKIIIGVDDKSHEIVGVDPNEVFKIIDGITNTISDMCYPQIFPNIGVDTIEGKCVIVVEIYPGANRPYYIKTLGKESGTFIRVSGTSRPADDTIIKDLDFQGTNRSFDEMVCVEQKYDAEQAEKLCAAIKKYMVDAAKTKAEKEKVRDVTVQNLINWGVIKNLEGTLVPTNAFVMLTNNPFPFVKIQCALFKGVERVVFIDKRDFEGPLYEQIEEAYKFVLKHINLEVKAGSYVALVGSSGAGKTTLCNLIPRFYEATSGKITIDGKDIKDIKLKDLRDNIGIVQQDVYLFVGTVYDNIRYGRPDATREEVIAAAKEANAYDFIMSLPNGFETDIGQRGIKLSGGQKQRISIARVFLKNPPILIFDEATSALDNESEKIVQESMEKLAKNRTTMVIAHRLSTIRNAEKILVLTDKGIEEQGTHKELMDKHGIYYDLYNVIEK